MKAMRISEFNKNAKLQMGDVQIPEVRSLDVLAEIHAASVNPLDIKIRNGLRAGYPLPLTMGSDFAGIVVKTGDGETKFKTGDRVYGRPNQKGLERSRNISRQIKTILPLSLKTSAWNKRRRFPLWASHPIRC